MGILSSFQNIFKIAELKSRVLFTLALLAVYRIGAHIPTPGINGDELSKFLTEKGGALMGFFDMFSGGALSRVTIFALGIMPYISASIIFQLSLMRTVQKLPASGEEREALRVKGQFWTPPWLAKLMAGWVVQDGAQVLFDPAVGPGTFFAAARELGFTGELRGCELHSNAFADGWKLGLSREDFGRVQISDFVTTALAKRFPAIDSNPPYIRHHRLTQVQASIETTSTRPPWVFARWPRWFACFLSVKISCPPSPWRAAGVSSAGRCLRGNFGICVLESNLPAIPAGCRHEFR